MLSQEVDLVLQSKMRYLFHTKSEHDNEIACQVYMYFTTESCRPMYILKVKKNLLSEELPKLWDMANLLLHESHKVR